MNAAHMEFCASPEWRQIVYELILPEALRGVDLGDDVIEIGPGPGFTTDILRSLSARLTAVEIDPDLAGALATRLAATNVDVLTGDATALDLPSDRFTGAVSFNMLHHVPTDDEQDRAFAELARVLRTGGVLVATDGVADDALREFHRGDWYNPIDPAELSTRLAAAGFDSVEVRIFDLGWICNARAA